MKLTCPKDGSALSDDLVCAHGHSFPRVEGIPVLLRDDVPQTIELAKASLAASDPPYYWQSVGITDAEREVATKYLGPVDAVAAALVAATNGIAYKHLVGALDDYPIPNIPLSGGSGVLLDIGCSWGRWSISAAKKGYEAVGIDPSLGAVLAASRVARALGVKARFICADARYLPFPEGTFDVVHSYSVLQHLSPPDVELVVGQVARVLKPHARSVIQMAHRNGVRSLYHQARRRFAPAAGFDVRYWSLGELRKTFSAIGPSRITSHCFGGLGLERSDARLMRWPARAVLGVSTQLARIPPLVHLADSVYVHSEKT